MVSERLGHLLSAAGADWVLWLLFGMSGLGLLLSLERALVYRAEDRRMDDLLAPLDRELSHGGFARARSLLQAREGLGARVAAAGLRLSPRGRQAVEDGLSSALLLERDRLEARLSVLASLGSNAPFVGLLGTVIGIMNAFQALAAGSGSGGAASGALMAAVGEALVATAVGIAVALPAIFAYNALQRWQARILTHATALSQLVLAYVGNEETVEEPAREAEPHAEAAPALHSRRASGLV